MQLLPADGWWACTAENAPAGDGRRRHVASRLVAWALVEVLDGEGERYQTMTGLSSWGTPCSLEEPSTTYWHREDIPEHARPGFGGSLSWPVKPLSSS